MTSVKPTRRERNMLFVPAARPAMIAKAAASAADAVCIDLEDSVPAGEKEACRANVVKALREIDFGTGTRMYRINAIDTHFAYRDLVDVVEAAGDRIDTIMLPKATSARDVHFVDTLLTQIEARQGFTRRIGIEAQIENAAGFVHLREIASASSRLECLIFGAGDYAASMRMPAAGIGTFDENDALYPGHRWHAVMHEIVANARANDLRCIDGPYSDFSDLAGFERACRIARAMGFDGKQCIHPTQLETAARVFTPSDAEVAHARRVVEAYDAAVAAGRGAVSLDGKMIDEANVRMARSVLNQLETR
jgi:citrate lyase subunit beta/citryl-CoA lyase